MLSATSPSLRSLRSAPVAVRSPTPSRVVPDTSSPSNSIASSPPSSECNTPLSAQSRSSRPMSSPLTSLPCSAFAPARFAIFARPRVPRPRSSATCPTTSPLTFSFGSSHFTKSSPPSSSWCSLKSPIASPPSPGPVNTDYSPPPRSSTLGSKNSSPFLPRPSAPPKVHSAVLRLTVEPKLPQLQVDESAFIDFLKLSFGQKRKTLVNNLRARYEPEDKNASMKAAGVKADARSEAISLEKMAALFKALDARSPPRPRRSRGYRSRRASSTARGRRRSPPRCRSWRPSAARSAHTPTRSPRSARSSTAGRSTSSARATIWARPPTRTARWGGSRAARRSWAAAARSARRTSPRCATASRRPAGCRLASVAGHARRPGDRVRAGGIRQPGLGGAPARLLRGHRPPLSRLEPGPDPERRSCRRSQRRSAPGSSRTSAPKPSAAAASSGSTMRRQS